MKGTKSAQHFSILFLGFSAVVICIALFSPPPARAQAKQFDSLGTVTSKTVACPNQGMPATGCYALDVSCPSIPSYTVYLKTFSPSSPPRGVVTLVTGGTSADLFEDNYIYGSVTVQDLIGDRFMVVELTFGSPFNGNERGWQTNVNGAGPRAASCRYATVTQWIKNKFAAQVPLCAAGLSAGSQQIGEGLAHYGLGQYLAFAELGSGPPFSRTDGACIHSNRQSVEYCSGADVSMNVSLVNAENYIDPAYPGPWCSQALETGSTLHQSQFLSDSVTSSDAVLSYPATTVWFLYGSLDNSSAINQGENYRLSIKTANHAGCVEGAPHAIADTLSGAEQFATDMSQQCVSRQH